MDFRFLSPQCGQAPELTSGNPLDSHQHTVQTIADCCSKLVMVHTGLPVLDLSAHSHGSTADSGTAPSVLQQMSSQ